MYNISYSISKPPFRTRQSTLAFGANLLGAVLGGVLEYTALVFGYRSLLLVVAGAYAMALITSRRTAGTIS